MPHMKTTGGKVKRSMPRNYKNAGPDAMGVTIDRPSEREKEPKDRSKVLRNPSKNIGRTVGFPKRGTPVSGIRARDHAEEMGKI